MKEQPLVTIYTITRNRADLLPRAMNSILNQTYNNIEYIIIDSASSDNTKDVVNSYSDSRIRYVRLEENKTFGSCVNLAFELASGKYVSELDDDDEYHLDKIEKQVKLFETLSDEYGMVYCWMTYFDNKTQKLHHIHKAELKGWVLDKVVSTPLVSGTPTLLIRRNIFKKIGGYIETNIIGEESDWELACRICRYYRIDFVPESLVNVYINHGHKRMSDSNYYYNLADVKRKFHTYFFREYRDVFERNPMAKVPHLYSISFHLFCAGHIREGWIYYRELLKISPSFWNLMLIPYVIYKKIKGYYVDR